MNIRKHIRKTIIEIKDQTITCENCGWEWKKSDGGKDPFTCHKCWHTNKEGKKNISESLNLNIVRIIRRAPHLKTFAIEMMEHYLRIYGPKKIEKVGFLDFEHMVVDAVWIDYVQDFFEIFDEDYENFDTTVSPNEINQIKNWMGETFRKDIIDFYKNKVQKKD